MARSSASIVDREITFHLVECQLMRDDPSVKHMPVILLSIPEESNVELQSLSQYASSFNVELAE